jgi:hypothetical protein
MMWGRMERIVGGEEWLEEVYNREEWKKFLRTARNCHILHRPMEWMSECQTIWCQILEYKAIQILLLHWFESNLPNYFGSTISDLGRRKICTRGRVPGPVNYAGTRSPRQTTVWSWQPSGCSVGRCFRDRASSSEVWKWVFVT